MKNKKLLKVLSTSFVLGTILVTNPTFAEKVGGGGGELPLSENLADKQDSASNVISETNDTNVISDESEVVEKEEKLELVNDDNSKENSEKLELSSDTEKEAVKADSGEIDPDLYAPNLKYDEPMKIDDPATYDYTKYMLNHYNPTSESFKEKYQQMVANITDIFKDTNNKIVSTNAVSIKGKDLSDKVDEFITELEKGRKENKLNDDYIEELENKIFTPDLDKYDFNTISVRYSEYFNTYLGFLSSMYMGTYEGDGDGHSLVDKNGKMIDSDYTFENFKKSCEDFKGAIQWEDEAGVNFAISDAFKNRPIVRVNYIFLSKEQYLQDKDKILDYLKRKVSFDNVVNRSTSIVSGKRWTDDNSEALPINIKKAFSEEELKKLNNNGEFEIIYDKQHINYEGNSHSKSDLSKELDDNYFFNKDSINANSFSLAIGSNLKDIRSNDLPVNYYLSKDDKPIYKADNKLKFKEKSDVVGSKYYISSSYNDKDEFIKAYRRLILDSLKDDEDFNKLTKEEQEEAIQSQIQESMLYIDEVHKDDKENIAKYQAFLNSEKWGNQRLTQYVGNVDTKTEEFDYKTIKKDDPTLEEGKTKVVTKGVKGKKVTKITYKVDRTSGELTDLVSEVVEDIKPIDEVILVGTKKVIPATLIEDIATTTKVTKEVIKAETSYEADDTLEFEKQNVVTKPVDGEKEITSKTASGKTTKTEKIIKDKVYGLTKVGNKKVEVETKDGITTTTTTVYEVEKTTGKLVNPKVTVHKTTKAGTIEDIATTTKTTKEVIKADVIYEADDTLEYEKQNVATKPVDGEKEITSKTTAGKTTKTEKVIKNKVDGLTKVGNKKVEVETKDGITTTTTTVYEVEKATGKLINPKVTVHKTTKIGTIEDIAKKTIPATKIEDIAKKTIPATKIEDIAKKTIPATKIEDIAKKTIPATKIEDIAKKTIPATKIEDIAKKTMPATKIENIAKNTNKNDEKDNSNEPKKDSHLPKAGVNSEILTLAIGALAMVEGINLSKKRRK